MSFARPPARIGTSMFSSWTTTPGRRVWRTRDEAFYGYLSRCKQKMNHAGAAELERFTRRKNDFSIVKQWNYDFFSPNLFSQSVHSHVHRDNDPAARVDRTRFPNGFQSRRATSGGWIVGNRWPGPCVARKSRGRCAVGTFVQTWDVRPDRGKAAAFGNGGFFERGRRRPSSKERTPFPVYPGRREKSTEGVFFRPSRRTPETVREF